MPWRPCAGSNGGKGVDYVIECSGAADAINEAARMLNRGGKICLAAFPHEPVPSTSRTSCATTSTSTAFAARAAAPRTAPRPSCAASSSTPRKIHTHTFPLDELPEALRYARDRVEDAIKVVVKTRPGAAAGRAAAE